MRCAYTLQFYVCECIHIYLLLSILITFREVAKSSRNHRPWKRKVVLQSIQASFLTALPFLHTSQEGLVSFPLTTKLLLNYFIF